MHKKELLNAILARDTKNLSDLLLTPKTAYVDTYYNSSTTSHSQVWAGDYLCHLCSKNKISEDDLLYVFSLENKKGNKWVDYIIRHNSKVCVGLFNILHKLVSDNFIQPANFYKLLFVKSRDGWNFATLIAKYQTSDIQLKFYALLSNLINTGVIDPNPILEGLTKKIDKGWTYFHCISYSPKEKKALEEQQVKIHNFIEFLTLLHDKNFFPGEKILELLRIETDDETIVFELMDNIKNFSPISNLLIAIHKKNLKLFSSIMELLTYSKNGLSLLYLILRLNAANIILPLYSTAVKNCDKGYPKNVVHVINYLARDINYNCLNLLVLPKNIELYGRLIEDIHLYVGIFKRDVNPDIYEKLDKLFLNRNEFNHSHLQLVVKFLKQKTKQESAIELTSDEYESDDNSEEKEKPDVAPVKKDVALPSVFTLQKLLSIYNFLLKDSQHFIDINFLDYLLAEVENGWTVFHLAARYLSEKDKISFNNFAKNVLDKLRIITLNPSDFKVTLPTHIPFQDPFEHCLVRLLDKDKEPSYLFLLAAFQSDKTFHDFLMLVKPYTLNNPTLRLHLLFSLAPIFAVMTEQKKNNTNWLKKYIQEYIERMLLDGLTEKDDKLQVELQEDEIKALQRYKKLKFGSANYLLHKYYQTQGKPEQIQCLEEALACNYEPAFIEASIRELESIFASKKIFPTFCSTYFKADNFLNVIERYRKLYSDSHYLLLLEESLNHFKHEKQTIFFELANYHYSEGNFKLMLEYLAKISAEVPSLSKERHCQLSKIYYHLSFYNENLMKEQIEKKNNNEVSPTKISLRELIINAHTYSYLAIKHAHFANQMDNEQDDFDISMQKLIFEKEPTLEALYRLELAVMHSNNNSLHKLIIKLRSLILKTLGMELTNNLKNICEMLTKWVNFANKDHMKTEIKSDIKDEEITNNNSDIQQEITTFAKKQKFKTGSGLFSFFSTHSNSELLTLIQEISAILMNGSRPKRFSFQQY